MFIKFASVSVTDFQTCSVRPVAGVKTAGGKRRLGSFEYEPRNDGHKYLYVSVRACTSDVPNKNFDMLPHEEVESAYRTFVGACVYLNHDNQDPAKARGAVIDAAYHTEDPDDKWVEILMEMDEERCPKLCSLIRSGEIDTVSMGCSVESTTCSVCGNVAEYPFEYCEHVQQKGREFQGRLAFEVCNGIEFFEESFVYDPADPTATVQALEKEARMAKAARRAQAGGDVPPLSMWSKTDNGDTYSLHAEGRACIIDSDAGKWTWFISDYGSTETIMSEGPDYVFDSAEEAYEDLVSSKELTVSGSAKRASESSWSYDIVNVGLEYDDYDQPGYFDPWSGNAEPPNVPGVVEAWAEVVITRNGIAVVRVELDDDRFVELVSDSVQRNDSIDDYVVEQVVRSLMDDVVPYLGDIEDEADVYGYESVEDEIVEYLEDEVGGSATKIASSDSDESSFANAPRTPEDVSTNEDSRSCPLCGSMSFDGDYCDVCGYQEPPEDFGDILLEDDDDYDRFERGRKEQDEEEQGSRDRRDREDEEIRMSAEKKMYDIGDDPALFISVCEDEGFDDEYELLGFDILETSNGILQEILEVEGAIEI